MLLGSLKELNENDEGFSLLDIVVTVGLMLILSVSGVSVFNGLNERSRESAKNVAADTVYSKAMAAVVDNDSTTDAEQVEREYNNSQTQNSNGKPGITVRVKENRGIVQVWAGYAGDENYAYRKTPTPGSDSTNPIEDDNGNSNEEPPLVIQDKISKFTFQCDDTTSGYLPVYNVDEDSIVAMFGSNNTQKLIKFDSPDTSKLKSNYGNIDFTNNTLVKTGWNNVSEKLTMRAGVKYTVTIDGTFDNFSAINENSATSTTGVNLSFGDCLVSVDKLGKDSGLLTMNFIGGKKLTKMPEQIPPTIKSLQALFIKSTIFNDSSVSNWDITNMNSTALNYAFANTDSFNQPLNWDFSSVTSLASTFQYSKSFNNGGEPLNWNTRNITNLSNTFRSATSINQNLNERFDGQSGVTYWDTSKVQYMQGMFDGATAFNNGNSPGVSARMNWKTDSLRNMNRIFANTPSFNAEVIRTTSANGNYWDTSNVTDMSQAFQNSTSFNNRITNWRTHNVTTMANMFDGATSFNRALATNGYIWNTSKVSNMDGMFKNTKAFNQDLTTWNVASVTSKKEFSTGSALSTENMPKF